VERPEIETFGENVGTLTSEVFGLEVTNSGFHRMIAEAAAGQVTYTDALKALSGQRVQPSASCPPGLADPGAPAFRGLGLGPLYSMQAARLISGIQALLDLLLREGDPPPPAPTSSRTRSPGCEPGSTAGRPLAMGRSRQATGSARAASGTSAQVMSAEHPG
jgi:hypothetical protein